MTTLTRSLMTAAEFEAIADNLGSCELVRGEVAQLSPAGPTHGLVTSNITQVLGRWAKEQRCGRVWSGETGVVVENEPDTVRGMDVAYVSYQRLPKGKRIEGFARTPPELVVEVVGQGRTWQHLVEKTGEYLRMGVNQVWVVDPATGRVHIFCPDREPRTLGESDELRDDSLLPGFSCHVAEFFTD